MNYNYVNMFNHRDFDIKEVADGVWFAHIAYPTGDSVYGYKTYISRYLTSSNTLTEEFADAVKSTVEEITVAVDLYSITHSEEFVV